MNYIIVALVILSFIIIFHSAYKVVGTPSKNEEKRKGEIELEVKSMGGETVSITKTKKSDCPYVDELGLEMNSLFVPYQVVYKNEDDEMKTGWAILIIKGTMIFSSLVSEDTWVFKLN